MKKVEDLRELVRRALASVETTQCWTPEMLALKDAVLDPPVASSKYVRCTTCGGEFSEEEIEDATACPSCGWKGVPMRIEDDLQITINAHELRILTVWASNWADQYPKECRPPLAGILRRLRPQVLGVSLTLGEEFQRVADSEGAEVLVANPGGGVETYHPRKPN